MKGRSGQTPHLRVETWKPGEKPEPRAEREGAGQDRHAQARREPAWTGACPHAKEHSDAEEHDEHARKRDCQRLVVDDESEKR